MSAEKRALDDLDALFRAASPYSAPASRPTKKVRHVSGSTDQVKPRRHPPSNVMTIGAPSSKGTGIGSATDNVSKDTQPTYDCLPRALLPLSLSKAPPPGRGVSRKIGPARAARVSEFIRGILGARGQRAAEAAIESRFCRKVVHLDNTSTQWDARSAPDRALRSAARAQAGRTLSRSHAKRKGLNDLRAGEERKLMFRDLLGLHELWQGYTSGLVSKCGSDQKLLQQRVLASDLQLLTPQDKKKILPKSNCIFRLAFGGKILDLNGRAFVDRPTGALLRRPPAAGGVDRLLQTTAV